MEKEKNSLENAKHSEKKKVTVQDRIKVVEIIRRHLVKKKEAENNAELEKLMEKIISLPVNQQSELLIRLEALLKNNQ